jgi:hypothetical protein
MHGGLGHWWGQSASSDRHPIWQDTGADQFVVDSLLLRVKVAVQHVVRQFVEHDNTKRSPPSQSKSTPTTIPNKFDRNYVQHAARSLSNAEPPLAETRSDVSALLDTSCCGRAYNALFCYH